MEMIDLGKTYGGMAEPSDPDKKIYYPEITLRGDKIPDIGDDEFYAVIKCRKVGMRNPSDGEKSCDIEVEEMSGPVDEAKAKALVGATAEAESLKGADNIFSSDKAVAAFRSTMKEIAKETQIGQSG